MILQMGRSHSHHSATNTDDESIDKISSTTGNTTMRENYTVNATSSMHDGKKHD